MSDLDIAGWCKAVKTWREAKGFETDWLNVPEKLMLVVTELGEAMEAYRRLPLWVLQKLDMGTLVDSDIHEMGDTVKPWYPWWENFEEEIADTVIRIFDLCGSLGIDLEKRLQEKMRKNLSRPKKHGKER